ncbi:hypothetical protein Tco_1576222 [Tanacetum coccineum]
MTAEHSSLSLTDETGFLSFSLCERRSFKTLAPLGMWIIASRKGRLIWICLKIDRSRSSSSSFFFFFNRDGKGLSSSVVPWVADGAGADGYGRLRVVVPDRVVMVNVGSLEWAGEVEESEPRCVFCISISLYVVHYAQEELKGLEGVLAF